MRVVELWRLGCKCCWMWRGEEHLIFEEGDLESDVDAESYRVVTMVSFVMRTEA